MSLPPNPPPPPIAPAGATFPQQPLSYAAPAMEAVVLTPRALDMLRQTHPWVAFIGTVMVVIGVLAMVVGVVGGSVAAARRAQGAAAFVLYILIALFYLFPGMYLRRYAAGI